MCLRAVNRENKLLFFPPVLPIKMIFQAAFLICSSPGADNELLTVFNSDATSSQCVCNPRLSPVLLEGIIHCFVNSVQFQLGSDDLQEISVVG